MWGKRTWQSKGRRLDEASERQSLQWSEELLRGRVSLTGARRRRQKQRGSSSINLFRASSSPASASLLGESHPTPNIEHLPSLIPTSTERLPRELLRTCSLSPSTLNLPPRSRASSVKLISQYRLAFGYSLYDAQLQEITPALICSDACALLALNYLILVFI